MRDIIKNHETPNKIDTNFFKNGFFPYSKVFQKRLFTNRQETSNNRADQDIWNMEF